MTPCSPTTWLPASSTGAAISGVPMNTVFKALDPPLLHRHRIIAHRGRPSRSHRRAHRSTTLAGPCRNPPWSSFRVRPAPAIAARTLDIDIIDWEGSRVSDGVLEIPHPRLAERLFVLGPLRDIAPDWRQPVTGIAIAELVAALGPGQKIRRLP